MASKMHCLSDGGTFLADLGGGAAAPSTVSDIFLLRVLYDDELDDESLSDLDSDSFKFPAAPDLKDFVDLGGRPRRRCHCC